MRTLCLIVLLAGLSSCDDLFEYSPYDVNASVSDVNENNIHKIRIQHPEDTIWFVALSDIHNWYGDLYDAVNKINSENKVSFVVVCGDISDGGLVKEFNCYYSIMKDLKAPFITVIGNHDYLSNGAVIYRKMFGALNFSFDLGQYRFICFDDISLEDANSFPDFEWLNTHLSDTSRTIQMVFSHVPPWTYPLNLDTSDLKQVITKKPLHCLVFHGHAHSFNCVKIHATHIVAGSVKDRTFSLIGVHDSAFVIKRIAF